MFIRDDLDPREVRPIYRYVASFVPALFWQRWKADRAAISDWHRMSCGI